MHTGARQDAGKTELGSFQRYGTQKDDCFSLLGDIMTFKSTSTVYSTVFRRYVLVLINLKSARNNVNVSNLYLNVSNQAVFIKMEV